MRRTFIFRGDRRRRRSVGAAVIEMVISLLVLFYLVMGGVEFGWYLFAKHIVQSAARDGARAAIIGSATHAQSTAAVSDTMTSAGFNSGYTTTFQRIVFNANGTTTTTTVTNISSVSRGDGLRVTVSAPFSAFRVRPLGVIPSSKSLVGTTTMVKE